MGISDTKKQIVIDNYFKDACDINTSIKEAFTKGFEVGLTKAVFPKDQYKTRLKADMVTILNRIRAEIEQNAYPIVYGVNNHEKGMTLYGILQIIDKYTAESEE